MPARAAAEGDRRDLTHADVHGLVRREADDLRAAAGHLEPHDPAEAEVKRRQAAALELLLRRHSP